MSDKEKRRKKQLKRMTKIVAQVWALPQSDPFQEVNAATRKSNKDAVFDLSSIGQKIDEGKYHLGKHGWEDFARDLGGVYNRHCSRKSKHCKTAKKHIEEVVKLLEKDPALATLAKNHFPTGDFVEESSNNNHHHSKKHANASGDNHKNNSHHSTATNNHKKRKSMTESESLLEQAAKGKLDLSLGERQEKALAALGAFVEEKGGSKDQISSFRAIVKRSNKKAGSSHSTKNREMYDITFVNDGGRKFRTMTQIAEFLDLIRKQPPKRMKTNNHHNSRHHHRPSKEVQNEKKKLRQQIDKLRKQYQNAAKKLDDFLNEEKESRYPIDDFRLLQSEYQQQQQQSDERQQQEEEPAELEYNPALLRSLQCKTYRGTKCAATRKHDLDTLPGIEPYCIPDVLMVWDFVCTFQKTIGLVPIPLDDFASALCYSPPEQVQGDDISSPPVYLAEAHIGLMKLLFQDRSSDDWWWSVLETDETENPNFLKEGAVGLGDDNDQDDAMRDDNEDSASSNVGPVIKIDVAALLAEPEEPLITTSWVQALEGIRSYRTKNQGKGKDKKKRNGEEEEKQEEQQITTKSAFKDAIRTSKALVTNKWVSAYLRKVLGVIKIDIMLAKKAVVWLIDLFFEARPDLWDSGVRQDAVNERRARLVDEMGQQMEKLDNAVAAINDEDVLSDDEEEDDDDDSDDEDDDENDEDDDDNEENNVKDESERPSSAIPPRPPPTLVDLMLPPAKPHHNAEFLNPHTWPQMAGATAHRVLHRLKRLRNELDDHLRGIRQLPLLTVAQRRQREALTASRVLSECASDITDDEDEAVAEGEDGTDENKKKINPCVKAIEHLCSGGNYLELSALERLCILRLLVEAAYDTDRVYQTVDGNFTERIRSMKALNNEQRRAKKEAKEKMLNDEAAAKEQLAMEARNKFLDEKRAEIRKVNEGSNEYTEEFVESLTDEDIIEFDEDIKADYDALPGPDSFNKNEVSKMVVRMQEEAALETHTLRVLTMEEVLQRDKAELEEMESQLQSLGGEEALQDPAIDRETSRSIERLQRDIEKTREVAVTLPDEREAAMEALRDAIADGTIKVLKGAVRQAKGAKLTGPDIETGGVWALNLVRDAAVELENAKQHKRVADAQKELVAKRNKCFIRNESLGLDRFRNRYWHFDNDDQGCVWIEAKMMLRDDKEIAASNCDHIPDTPPPGYLDLTTDNISSIAIGGEDMEEDLEDSEDFQLFSRREYHASGRTPTLVKYKWGCQATEDSLRAMIRNLDGRGIRENELKNNVKEALEERVGMVDNKNDHPTTDTTNPSTNTNGAGAKEDNDEDEAKEDKIQSSGDEEVFHAALQVQKAANQRDGTIVMDLIQGLSSGIGQNVRVRNVVDNTKDPAVARYEEGTITGWKTRQDTVEVKPDTDNSMMETDDEEAELDDEEKVPITKIVDVPVWQATTKRGHIFWLTGVELLESMCRFSRCSSGDKSYFEYDSAFLSYRNSTGRPYCGRAPEAAFSSSPMNFARSMVKREQELYPKLKSRTYDDNWGGRSGARAAWTTSMRDYTFDFISAREGLLTLENAIFELTGGIESEQTPSGKEILETPSTRDDIELESLDKEIGGLWNTPESRAVFKEIIASCTTTGFLSLGLNLLCRNTMAYIAANKLLNARSEPSISTRSSRRMNAWQQANNESYY